jgi:hypothetical protein
MQDHPRQIDETLLRRTAGPYIAPEAEKYSEPTPVLNDPIYA